jgi:hypothetical protein
VKKLFLFGLFVGLFFVGSKVHAGGFGDVIAVSTSTRFQNRCNYALQVAAVNVMAEVSTTTAHRQRVDFAIKVFNGTGPTLSEVALATLTNATIAGEENSATLPDQGVPDGDIQFAINALFNALAGVAN